MRKVQAYLLLGFISSTFLSNDRLPLMMVDGGDTVEELCPSQLAGQIALRRPFASTSGRYLISSSISELVNGADIPSL